jgi:hypothetical protein
MTATLAASTLAPRAARAQVVAVAATRAQTAGASARPVHDSLYSSAEADFVVGKTVYLRSSKMRIGSIIDTDANHKFPRTFPRPRMKAVLIRRKDGPVDWVPVERINRIYVVNK